ncbi:MAG: hypothetical protein GY953_58870 [bacterium]|nr:hypothetical protein [bacterium]
MRIPDLDPPAVSLAGAAHVPAGAVSTIPLRVGDPVAWPHMRRSHGWSLVANGHVTPVPARISAASKTVEVDLRKANPAPGVYRLAAKWDWSALAVDGEVEVHALPGGVPELTRESKDRLVEGSGPVRLRMVGCDFQFIEKAELLSGTDVVQSLEFRLPDGPRAGKQTELDITLQTENLKAGTYTLSLAMPDGVRRDTAVRVHPPHPRIETLPWRVHLGEAEQRFALEGEGIERIARLESAAGEITLDGSSAVVRLQESATQGDRADLVAQVEGIETPVRIPDAVVVVGPRPRILDARASLPANLSTELRDGELPAGSFVSFSLEVEQLDGSPELRLECAEQRLTLNPQRIRPGEQTELLRLRNAGPNTLFLSLDPASVGRPGCTLTAVIATESQGESDAHRLGRVVRLPRVDRFELSSQRAGKSTYEATLQGEDLELIERVGWDATTGVEVKDLPEPVAAGGHQQRLRIALPWPSPAPHSPLFIWLRGEARGRATTARY